MNVQNLSLTSAIQSERVPHCRLCASPLRHSFVDLGMSPLCESFLKGEQLDAAEPYFPLHVLVCEECFLVQLREYVSPEHIFREYAYFSSFSTSWVDHARRYCQMIAKRLESRRRQPRRRAGLQ